MLNNQPVTIESDTIRLSASNTSYPFTNNFKALLYGEDVKNIDNYDDLVNYLNFTSEARSSQVAFRRKNLVDRINDLREKIPIGNGLINSNEKIMKRLGVLSSAYKAGHTNVLKEMTAILDDLLERKIITKRQYRDLSIKK